MIKHYCDNCEKEAVIDRPIQVFIPTLKINRPNKHWPGNNVFTLDLCKGCFNSVCDDILKRFNKSSKDIK